MEHLRQLPDDERPLYDTPAEFGRESRRLEASLRFLLGEELRKAGETAAAIVEFEAADDLGGWMPELYRARLEANVPLQEAGRLTGRELSLARANRSVSSFSSWRLTCSVPARSVSVSGPSRSVTVSAAVAVMAFVFRSVRIVAVPKSFPS